MRYVTLTFAPDEYGMYPGAETVTMPVANLRHYFWGTRCALAPMSVRAARWALDNFGTEPIAIEFTEEA